MRNPFAQIPIELFQQGRRQYPALGKFFDKRVRRLVSRGLVFFELPVIYQWMIVPTEVAQLKLESIDRALEFLSAIDKALDRKIREIANLMSDAQMFRFFTELLVIHRLLRSGGNNFVYEECLQGSRSKFDINLDFQGRRIRVDVTHKEDSYPLGNTADTIKANLQYADPQCGGRIDYAPPFQQNYEDGSVTVSHDLTPSQIRLTIENALTTMASLKSGSASVDCASPFIRITLNRDSTAWIGMTGGSWYAADVNSHLSSIRHKARKSQDLVDNSYKIIAVDLEPSSDFHDASPYRDQLKQRLIQCDLATISTIDEVISFSMRFENGEFESLEPLWTRDPAGQSIFTQLIH